MFNFLKISPKIIFSIDNFMLYTNTIPYIISIWNDEIQIFKIWKITFKLITLNYEIYNLENIQSIILLFFTSKTNQSIDFLKYINKKNNNFCNELINYWWNIIINIILPLYFYFPMKNSPSYKSNQKNLSNNLLLIFFEFFLIYLNKTNELFLNFNNLNSSIVIISILKQIFNSNQILINNYLNNICLKFIPINLNINNNFNNIYSLNHCLINDEIENNIKNSLEIIKNYSFDYISILLLIFSQNIIFNN